jgi:hypothetical protein
MHPTYIYQTTSNRCQGSNERMPISDFAIYHEEGVSDDESNRPYALFPQTCDGVTCGVDAFIIFPLWLIRIHLMLYWNKSMGSIQYK